MSKRPAETRRVRADRIVGIAGLVAMWVMMAIGPVPAATEEGADPGDEAQAELLLEGREIYQASCAVCHQPDGRGLGDFPALRDNANVQDAEYVATIIRNGRGQMPAGLLTDDRQIEAVTAYLQAGLVASASPADVAATGEVAGTELPFAVVVTYALGFLTFLAVAAVIAGPYVLARDSRHAFDGPRVWLKAGAIFIFFTVATVVLPNWILGWGPVTRAPRLVQDLVGSGVWIVALGAGLWALWRGQRERIL